MIKKKRIFIASDHGGFELKEKIKKHFLNKNYNLNDIGTNNDKSVDYPDFAKKLIKKIKTKNDLGILICGTGIGMSIVANRFSHIRAALCHNEFEAKMSRNHNDANVLCIGARVIGDELAYSILNTFIKENFDGTRHTKRIKKINL